MKLLIKASLLSAMVLFMVSCGGNNKNAELDKKKEALEKLKKDQAENTAEIKKLEQELAILDTTNKKADKAKLVILDTVKVESFTHYIDLQGKVDADNISYISPRGAGGQVRAVYVKEGEFVRKGQLLLKLDDAIIRQNVVAARQGLAGVRNQLELAKSVYQRTKNLWEQRIGTEMQLLQAKTNVDVLENQIKTQQENIRVAEAQLATTNVISNVSGVADEVNIHVGEMFTGAPTASIKIVNTTNLKVVTDVPENYLSRVAKGTPVLISVPDINKTYKSTISIISQSISTTSRGFIAEAKIPQDKSLKPNLTANVRIQDYTTPNAITIPVNTLQTDEQGKFVLVAVKEGNTVVARKRQIQVGELYGDRLEVKGGLQTGDVIITEGFQSLYDGQLVTTVA
ncbi:efflux RND transporter periplasmic adaptor subunit [Segetibacter sp.]|uniref:efflux RND transporter periplasmic adaptor subunit n=1 Tax=Segetibacter sp. TaxID=2231182 RepID=UPI0026350615|nr:efflux RND transporter periplasmic adaptor subunit [Segetibacter sp.]MCW3081319.1 efflux transporter periplasmic adaptor subunit [Segetibacter sp.]